MAFRHASGADLVQSGMDGSRQIGDLTGLVAVITGGNRGIGLGIAEALAAAGADIALWARDETRNRQACEKIEPTGRRVVPIRCDVADERAVQEAMAITIRSLGRVDTLFANAGFSVRTPFLDMSLSEWRQVMSTNLEGAFLCFREAARHMVERAEGGALVAVSSVAAYFGAPTMEHYAASKSALISLTRSLAVELARYDVRCNALAPGWTKTDMSSRWLDDERFASATTQRIPRRRWASPADLGAAAVFLADPRFGYHTGDCLVVDGGYSIF
jgi:NAD(P)-dependent dehydrogenase (short-subunit alcohol dehydrogenase family)